MKAVIKTSIGVASLVLLTACGGGGGGGSGGGGGGGSSPTATFYQNIDLSETVNTQTLQLPCVSSASRIELMRATYNNVNQTYKTYRFFIDGNLSLPSAPGSCSVNGLTGNITGVRMTINDAIAYEMTGVNIDASNILFGWRYFWTQLNNAATTIQASSPTANTQLACTDSRGNASSLTLTGPGNIKQFISACVQ